MPAARSRPARVHGQRVPDAPVEAGRHPQHAEQFRLVLQRGVLRPGQAGGGILGPLGAGGRQEVVFVDVVGDRRTEPFSLGRLRARFLEQSREAVRRRAINIDPAMLRRDLQPHLRARQPPGQHRAVRRDRRVRAVDQREDRGPRGGVGGELGLGADPVVVREVEIAAAEADDGGGERAEHDPDPQHAEQSDPPLPRQAPFPCHRHPFLVTPARAARPAGQESHDTTSP